MRAHYLQHVPFEGLGSIEPWLKSNGYALSSTPFFATTRLPDPQSIDLLIVMGGPMSVNDDDEFPWLDLEKQFIREVIALDKPVLGICLGAQLIASAMGANVFPNRVKEIGWFPVHAVASADPSVFRFPASQTVFHWHGDTFEWPPHAVPLASSEGCEHQAFQLGQRVIGLQFHLETTPEAARDLVAHCRHELVPARYVQTEADILSAPSNHYQSINDLMSRILYFLTHSEN
jgi:GMP synthase-like glutamine amidotransferase